MLNDILLLLVGLALIIKGGDWFVSASVRIAELLRMPRVVIGSTLVSLTTTCPEMVVSVMAGLRGESGLAVGNAVGSCICNIGLILGLMASMKHVKVHPRSLKVPLIAMLLGGLLLLLITLDLEVSRLQGLVLLTLGACYFAYDFIHHKRAALRSEQREAVAIETEKIVGHPWLQSGFGTACQFGLGAVTVIVGSKFLVDSAVSLAGALGIPSIIIGLTVVAVGTSLPELVTALTSSRRNVSDLAVGNVLGANIANMTLVVGTAASIHAVSMSRVTQLFNFPAMLVLMILATVMVISDSRVSRKEGGVLLGFYTGYIAVLVLLAVLGEK
jgi:cation:H+ antiporter